MTDPLDGPAGVTMRTAATSDERLLLGFMRAFYAHFSYPFDDAVARAALLPMLAPDSPFGRVWIIERARVQVGYLVLMLGYSLEHRGRDAFVDELFVDRAHRGCGVGRAALEAAERACVDLGVQALHLEVERDNPGGQALYRKIGFRDNDRLLLTKRITG